MLTNTSPFSFRRLGSPDNVDLIVGGMLEPSSDSSHLGPLFSRIVCHQFHRTQRADPFFFTRPGLFSQEELQVLNATRLSDLLKRNTQANIPDNAFAVDINQEKDHPECKYVIAFCFFIIKKNNNLYRAVSHMLPSTLSLSLPPLLIKTFLPFPFPPFFHYSLLPLSYCISYASDGSSTRQHASL